MMSKQLMHLAFLNNDQTNISHLIMHLLENYHHFSLPVLYSYANDSPEKGSQPLANL